MGKLALELLKQELPAFGENLDLLFVKPEEGVHGMGGVAVGMMRKMVIVIIEKHISAGIQQPEAQNRVFDHVSRLVRAVYVDEIEALREKGAQDLL